MLSTTPSHSPTQEIGQDGHALLEIRGLTKEFGGLKAVNNFDISISKGELVGVIGPNGAGKTTVFNLITGIFPVSSGSINFLGKNILGMKPFK
ncbi:MAG: ATP-binding cassette domain-containing protein, partial [Anaerolineales bacterium]